MFLLFSPCVFSSPFLAHLLIYRLFLPTHPCLFYSQYPASRCMDFGKLLSRLPRLQPCPPEPAKIHPEQENVWIQGLLAWRGWDDDDTVPGCLRSSPLCLHLLSFPCQEPRLHGLCLWPLSGCPLLLIPNSRWCQSVRTSINFQLCLHLGDFPPLSVYLMDTCEGKSPHFLFDRYPIKP